MKDSPEAVADGRDGERMRTPEQDAPDGPGGKHLARSRTRSLRLADGPDGESVLLLGQAVADGRDGERMRMPEQDAPDSPGGKHLARSRTRSLRLADSPDGLGMRMLGQAVADGRDGERMRRLEQDVPDIPDGRHLARSRTRSLRLAVADGTDGGDGCSLGRAPSAGSESEAMRLLELAMAESRDGQDRRKLEHDIPDIPSGERNRVPGQASAGEDERSLLGPAVVDRPLGEDMHMPRQASAGSRDGEEERAPGTEDTSTNSEDSEDERTPGPAAPESDGPAGEHVRMLESATLREFWEFATTVRRTRSLALRESAKLRGIWLTRSLAVQRVHGWGARAVRLLCVHADSEERAAKLRLFFQKDRHNLEGRLVIAKDPLDGEKQVIVKIPYDVSLAGCVEHERAVLHDLAGLEGIPLLAEPIYFEDIGVPAATYRYSSAPSLQEQLEAGHLVPPEGLHRLLSFVLSVLAQAHKRGWLHTDLHPRDILLDTAGVARPEEGAAAPANLLCGWAHSVRRQPSGDGPDVSQGLAALVRQLPVTLPKPPRPRPGAESVLEDAEPPQSVFNSEAEGRQPAAAAGADDGSPASSEGRRGREAGGPSTFSAPEQLLGLYAGVGHDAASTDIYRAAAAALVAVRARGPLGTAERPMDPGTAKCVEHLRRLCHGALRRRAESTGTEALPTADETAEFAAALEQLLAEEPELSGCGGPELEPWFHRCLAREPRERHRSAEEALEAFDEAWSRLEARLLQERQAAAEAAEAARAAGEAAAANRRPRLVLEKPEALEEMEVL